MPRRARDAPPAAPAPRRPCSRAGEPWRGGGAGVAPGRTPEARRTREKDDVSSVTGVQGSGGRREGRRRGWQGREAAPPGAEDRGGRPGIAREGRGARQRGANATPGLQAGARGGRRGGGPARSWGAGARPRRRKPLLASRRARSSPAHPAGARASLGLSPPRLHCRSWTDACSTLQLLVLFVSGLLLARAGKSPYSLSPSLSLSLAAPGSPSPRPCLHCSARSGRLPSWCPPCLGAACGSSWLWNLQGVPWRSPTRVEPPTSRGSHPPCVAGQDKHSRSLCHCFFALDFVHVSIDSQACPSLC